MIYSSESTDNISVPQVYEVWVGFDPSQSLTQPSLSEGCARISVVNPLRIGFKTLLFREGLTDKIY